MLTDEASTVTEPDFASILLCLPDGTPFVDPDPDETARRAVDLVDEWNNTVIGIVGWSNGGDRAIDIAAAHPELARLAIVSTPFPGKPDRLAMVRAKTLLMFGSADPATGSGHGRRWHQALPDARLEMVPRAGHDILQQSWKRILSHLAPGRLRNGG